eukprot:scaffold8360_cov286-Pinguiococcus_pyrenoidosus.AAC.2
MAAADDVVGLKAADLDLESAGVSQQTQRNTAGSLDFHLIFSQGKTSADAPSPYRRGIFPKTSRGTYTAPGRWRPCARPLPRIRGPPEAGSASSPGSRGHVGTPPPPLGSGGPLTGLFNANRAILRRNLRLFRNCQLTVASGCQLIHARQRYQLIGWLFVS